MNYLSLVLGLLLLVVVLVRISVLVASGILRMPGNGKMGRA